MSWLVSEREDEDEREDSSSALARRATMPALAQLERALVPLREGGGKGSSGDAGELGFSEAAAAAARERGVVRERYWASLTACLGGSGCGKITHSWDDGVKLPPSILMPGPGSSLSSGAGLDTLDRCVAASSPQRLPSLLKLRLRHCWDWSHLWCTSFGFRALSVPALEQ